jgi:hypothetical protein
MPPNIRHHLVVDVLGYLAKIFFRARHRLVDLLLPLLLGSLLLGFLLLGSLRVFPRIRRILSRSHAAHSTFKYDDTQSRWSIANPPILPTAPNW